ncbi:hypothetical protein PGQ11_012623 [Apiospora arundinis]|uniref:Uncharacterized protein n=1 Tax=Apiospora arundinis TaxID=335852 RepID=A0ABR2I3C0_9PEZI
MHIPLQARATALVEQAEHRHELPPKDMDPSKLSGKVTLPVPAELPGINRLRELVDELEAAFCQDTHEIHKHATSYDDYLRSPQLRESVRKAVFRVLISGPALAGAYTEPFFEAKKMGMSHVNDLNFLEKFNVYDPHQDSVASKKTAFERLAEWLAEDIISDTKGRGALEFEATWNGERRVMKPACGATRPCSFASPGKYDCLSRQLIINNVFQLIWVYRHMWINMESDTYIFGWKDKHQLGFERKVPRQDEKKDDLDNAPIVLFGRFQTERVAISRVLSSRPRLGWLNPLNTTVYTPDGLRKLNPKLESQVETGNSVMSLLSWAYRFSPPWDGPASDSKIPLDHAFFDYVLKQYAGVRIKPEQARLLLSPVRILDCHPQRRFRSRHCISDFLSTFEEFLGFTKQLAHRRVSHWSNLNCRLLEGYTPAGVVSNNCKDIGAARHLYNCYCGGRCG